MRVSRPNRRYQTALWIDRWVGPPLCALLLGSSKLASVLRPGRRLASLPPLPPLDRVEKILVLKMWGMGSIVLAAPMLRRLRERHPEARIDFLSLRENERILQLLPDVDRIVGLDLGRGIPAFLWRTFLTIRELRRERYDLLYDLEFFTRFSAILSFIAAPVRSHGFSAKGKWRGRLQDVEVPFNAYHHVAANFLTLLRSDPMEPVDETEISGDAALPKLQASEEAWQRCLEAIEGDPNGHSWRDGAPIVVVNPNAGDMALERRWPRERAAAFLKHLDAEGRANVVVSGSPAERVYAESVVSACGAGTNILNLAGRIDIPELVALLSHAQVVVTNDSGPLHLAAASGASTVALFGPETPTLYGPLRSRAGQQHEIHYRRLACSPCMFIHDNKVLSCWFAQARCMMGIQSADVLASVNRLLAGVPGLGSEEPRQRAGDS